MVAGGFNCNKLARLSHEENALSHVKPHADKPNGGQLARTIRAEPNGNGWSKGTFQKIEKNGPPLTFRGGKPIALVRRVLSGVAAHFCIARITVTTQMA